MHIPKDIKLLTKIEQNEEVVSLFQYKETSAWISIKDMLTAVLYDSNVRLETGSKKEIVSWEGIKTIGSSFKRYLFHLMSKKEKILFLGASTGLFRFEGKVLDSYFPYYELEPLDSIYMLNCGNLRALNGYKVYTKQNQVVVENYLVVVFKKLLAKLIFIPKEKIEQIELFNKTLKEQGIDVSEKMLLSKYREFVAGYRLYRLFFKFLKIKKAYIVSAPSKSDMVGALKSLGLEVVEVQHGVVGKLHRGYNYAFKQNPLLPTVNKIDVYNQFWSDEVLNGGYFNASQLNIVGRLKYDIVKSDIDTLKFNYLLFTGQGAFFEQIIAFFNASDGVLNQRGIKLLYKAHPRELPNEIENFKKAIEPLESCSFYEGEATTEELIKSANAHISVFSSCHFDAVYYKEKTYILDVMEENIMSYYAAQRSDSFIKIKKIEELLDVK
jgi:hypothetical protein